MTGLRSASQIIPMRRSRHQIRPRNPQIGPIPHSPLRQNVCADMDYGVLVSKWSKRVTGYPQRHQPSRIQQKHPALLPLCHAPVLRNGALHVALQPLPHAPGVPGGLYRTNGRHVSAGVRHLCPAHRCLERPHRPETVSHRQLPVPGHLLPGPLPALQPHPASCILLHRGHCRFLCLCQLHPLSGGKRRPGTARAGHCHLDGHWRPHPNGHQSGRRVASRADGFSDRHLDRSTGALPIRPAAGRVPHARLNLSGLPSPRAQISQSRPGPRTRSHPQARSTRQSPLETAGHIHKHQRIPRPVHGPLSALFQCLLPGRTPHLCRRHRNHLLPLPGRGIAQYPVRPRPFETLRCHGNRGPAQAAGRRLPIGNRLDAPPSAGRGIPPLHLSR